MTAESGVTELTPVKNEWKSQVRPSASIRRVLPAFGAGIHEAGSVGPSRLLGANDALPQLQGGQRGAEVAAPSHTIHPSACLAIYLS